MNRQRFILFAIILSSTAAGLFLLREPITQALEIPYLYFSFLLRWISTGVPKAFYWIVLTSLGGLLALRSMQSRMARQNQRRVEGRQQLSRIELWSRWIDDLDRGRYFKWRAANRLSKLLVEILAYREKVEPDHILKKIEAGDLDLPFVHASYLQVGLNSRSIQTRVMDHTLLEQGSTDEILKQNPAHIIRHFEEIMEG